MAVAGQQLLFAGFGAFSLFLLAGNLVRIWCVFVGFGRLLQGLGAVSGCYCVGFVCVGFDAGVC